MAGHPARLAGSRSGSVRKWMMTGKNPPGTRSDKKIDIDIQLALFAEGGGPYIAETTEPADGYDLLRGGNGIRGNTRCAVQKDLAGRKEGLSIPTADAEGMRDQGIQPVGRDLDPDAARAEQLSFGELIRHLAADRSIPDAGQLLRDIRGDPVHTKQKEIVLPDYDVPQKRTVKPKVHESPQDIAMFRLTGETGPGRKDTDTADRPGNGILSLRRQETGHFSFTAVRTAPEPDLHRRKDRTQTVQERLTAEIQEICIGRDAAGVAAARQLGEPFFKLIVHSVTASRFVLHDPKALYSAGYRKSRAKAARTENSQDTLWN